MVMPMPNLTPGPRVRRPYTPDMGGPLPMPSMVRPQDLSLTKMFLGAPRAKRLPTGGQTGGGDGVPYNGLPPMTDARTFMASPLGRDIMNRLMLRLMGGR